MPPGLTVHSTHSAQYPVHNVHTDTVHTVHSLVVVPRATRTDWINTQIRGITAGGRLAGRANSQSKDFPGSSNTGGEKLSNYDLFLMLSPYLIPFKYQDSQKINISYSNLIQISREFYGSTMQQPITVQYEKLSSAYMFVCSPLYVLSF